jgi:oligoribonuclease NrnB/cAMP/cGMP phosphodiesterase (DHH superfamily)
MRYVLYHKNCIDGLFSAWVAWKKFGFRDIIYIGVKYYEPFPLAVLNNLNYRDEIYILDFSYDRLLLEGLHNNNIILTVLDHHDTAEKELKGLEYCVFNNAESGATLSWNHFFPNEPCPRLLNYVKDRDLWNWELWKSRETSEGIKSLGLLGMELENSFKTIDQVNHKEGITELQRIGGVLLNYKNVLLEDMCKYVYKVRYVRDEYDFMIGMINCGTGDLISELGEMVLKKNDDIQMAMIYSLNLNDQVVNVSVRGSDRFMKDYKELHVGEFAKMFEGGGHKNSGGFKMKILDFLTRFT